MPSEEVAVYNRLRLLRTERNESTQELAEALGINRQTVSYVERGDHAPSLELALKIARHYQLPLEQLFSLVPFGSSFTSAPLSAAATADLSLASSGPLVEPT